MIAETKYCLANLANFNGRDSRATFWWYMLAIIILQVVLGALLAGPMMAGMMGSLAESARQGISPEAAQAEALGTMFSSMQDWLIYGTVLAVISVILFAAAFVRRLHDSNKPGWIVLIPIATTAISQVMGYQFINDALPAMQAAMEARSAQYDTVMPRPSRADSTPRKPGCCAASSTMRSAMAP